MPKKIGGAMVKHHREDMAKRKAAMLREEYSQSRGPEGYAPSAERAAKATRQAGRAIGAALRKKSRTGGR